MVRTCSRSPLRRGRLSEDIIRYIDRYLMYYIRTADKLQRTARWLEDLDEEHGDGLAHLQSVLIEDSLGVRGPGARHAASR